MAKTLREFQDFLQESNDAAGRHRTQTNYLRGWLKKASRRASGKKLTKIKDLQDNVATYGVACTNIETAMGALQRRLALEFPQFPDEELRSTPIGNETFLAECMNLAYQIERNLTIANQQSEKLSKAGLPVVSC